MKHIFSIKKMGGKNCKIAIYAIFMVFKLFMLFMKLWIVCLQSHCELRKKFKGKIAGENPSQFSNTFLTPPWITIWITLNLVEYREIMAPRSKAKFDDLFIVLPACSAFVCFFRFFVLWTQKNPRELEITCAGIFLCLAVGDVRGGILHYYLEAFPIVVQWFKCSETVFFPL